MKPCSRNRKPIAWLALGALEPEEAQAIRAHIATCEGCRRYWEELSSVSQTLSAAGTRKDIEAQPSFHHTVLRALQAEESRSLWATVTAHLRETALSWRVALPSVLAAMILLLAALLWHPGGPAPAPPQVGNTSMPNPRTDLPPTIGNYQLVASRSLDELDALLARQAGRHRPSAQIFTASTSGLDQAPN